MIRNLILIVDPRSIIKKNTSTLNRHILYSKELAESTQGEYILGIASFTREKSLVIETMGELLMFGIPRTVWFKKNRLAAVLETLNEEFSVSLLVAGDPWESFLVAATFSKLLRNSPDIQIQVHGDIGNQLWIRLNWRNRIRSYLTFMTLKNATEIRATSALQADNLISKYKVGMKKIIVVPVPSLFTKGESIATSSTLRPKAIGLVGRLEYDRGLDTFTELARKLSKVNSDFSVVVVGAGRHREKFEGQLATFLKPNQLLFLGELDSAKMHIAWQKIGVLVSCAPTESYGRAMREALVYGVPVWATRSSGMLDLQEIACKDVETLTISDSTNKLNEEFQKLLRRNVDPGVRERLRTADGKLVSALISSWISRPERDSAD